MFALTKECLTLLKRGGSIINTTSVTAYKGSGGFVDCACPAHFIIVHRLHYCFTPDPSLPDAATKGAILAYTRSLNVQLNPKGIRANAV